MGPHARPESLSILTLIVDTVDAVLSFFLLSAAGVPDSAVRGLFMRSRLSFWARQRSGRHGKENPLPWLGWTNVFHELNTEATCLRLLATGLMMKTTLPALFDRTWSAGPQQEDRALSLGIGRFGSSFVCYFVFLTE